MEELEGLAEEGAKPTVPGGFYSQDGDCIFYYTEDVPHRAQRINALLTVYRAEDDRRVVGVEIKGIRKLAQAKASEIFFEDGRASIVPLIVETWKIHPTDPLPPSRRVFGEGYQPRIAARNSSTTSRFSDYFDAISAFSPVVRTEGLQSALGD